jgi:2'-5' RNA ligase
LSGDGIRSFIAVDLDDPAIKARISNVQRDLEQTHAQLKMVEPELMHLTLRFLGEIHQQTVDRVIEILGSVRFQPFDVTFSGVGTFPSLSRINIIWIGIIRGQEHLSEIFQQLEPKLRQIGMAADNKGFNPHLTIARVKSGLNREALANAVKKMHELQLGNVHVKCVRLKKSTLTPRGPIYTTIHEVQAAE